jgi:hypothetical protein
MNQKDWIDGCNAGRKAILLILEHQLNAELDVNRSIQDANKNYDMTLHNRSAGYANGLRYALQLILENTPTESEQ